MPGTYKDIQRMTGLSLSTISKYFNGKNVSEKNRAVIEQAARELDYRVNVFAQSLKSRRSRAIGILIPELNGAFNSSIMSEVGHFLREHGYGVLVCDCHGEPDIEPEALEFLLDRQVDGLVIIPCARQTCYQKLLAGRGVPAVVIDRVLEDFSSDTVVLDNRKAGGIAAEELLRHGHTQVGVISGESWIYSMSNRKWGFWRTLQRYGITPNPDHFTYTAFSIEAGKDSVLQLLQGRRPPTALFATNDLLTLGAVVAIQELGLSLPEDISLIGFDSPMLMHILGKPMTMITQPIPELAATAARLLLERIDHPEQHLKRRIAMVQPILHSGETVRTLNESS